MAPKGGGKGGSSHGSSGSKSDGSGKGTGSGGYSGPTNWSLQRQLSGSHFKKPVVLVALAIACLCLLGIIIIAAWSYVVKPKGRKVFKWFGLPLALTAVFFYMALNVVDRFLHEFQVTVPAAYAFLYVAAEYFLLKASVLLLIIVYSIIKNRIQSIWKDVSRFRIWQLLHKVFAAALILVWIIDVIAFLVYYIGVLSSPINTTTSSANQWLDRWRKVNGAFHILYFVAAVDIMVCAVVIASGARSKKVPSLISKYLVILIAPILLLRSLVLAVYSITFTVLSHPETDIANMAYVILYGIPTVIIFAGVVRIATQGDWFPEYQAVQQGGMPPDQNVYPPPSAHPAHIAYDTQTAYTGQYSGQYAAQGTYPAKDIYYGQTPIATPVPQPWTPPPPPQPHYDTSYQRQI